MQVAVHLGFHCTDDERLLRCLLRNAAVLEAAGVAVPQPQAYRPALREAQAAIRDGVVPEEVARRATALLAPSGSLRRVVLSHPNLICFPGRAIGPEGLYAIAPERLSGFGRLLGDAPWEAHVAIRNPATLVPALLEQLPGTDYAALMQGLAILQLSWAETLRAIRTALPDLPMVIWCNEDLPLIWPELLRRLAGVAPDFPLDGDEDMLGALLTPVGMATLAAYLKTQGPIAPRDRRRLTTALLERYAQPGAIEVELDLPGWTSALVEEVTDAYYSDVAAIAALPGVEFLTP